MFIFILLCAPLLGLLYTASKISYRDFARISDGITSKNVSLYEGVISHELRIQERPDMKDTSETSKLSKEFGKSKTQKTLRIQKE